MSPIMWHPCISFSVSSFRMFHATSHLYACFRGIRQQCCVGLLQGVGFINTPSGVMYPVTPPKTPDCLLGTAAAGDATPLDLAARSSDSTPAPACCCQMTGVTFDGEDDAPPLCHGLDSIDGKVRMTYMYMIRYIDIIFTKMHTMYSRLTPAVLHMC